MPKHKQRQRLQILKYSEQRRQTTGRSILQRKVFLVNCAFLSPYPGFRGSKNLTKGLASKEPASASGIGNNKGQANQELVSDLVRYIPVLRQRETFCEAVEVEL